MKKILLIILHFFIVCGQADAKKPKLANSVWFIMEHQDNKKQQPNDSVKICYRLTDDFVYDGWYGYKLNIPHILISIQNNTERTVFIDLQKSFIVVAGDTYPLFTSQTNISTQGSTIAGGVGFGLIGMGSASTNVNSTVTQEQRVLIIPGESKKELDLPFVAKWGKSWKLNNGCGKIICMHYSNRPNFLLLKQNFINDGQLLTYNTSETPFNLDFRISYSFSEDMGNTITDKTVYYTAYAIGSKNKGCVLNNKDTEKDYQKAVGIFPQLTEFINNSDVLIVHIWDCPKY